MVSSPFFLQVVNSVVGDFHFFFQHREALGEPVMVPDLPGQLLNLGIGDSLGNLNCCCTFLPLLRLVMMTPISDRPPVISATMILSIWSPFK